MSNIWLPLLLAIAFLTSRCDTQHTPRLEGNWYYCEFWDGESPNYTECYFVNDSTLIINDITFGWTTNYYEHKADSLIFRTYMNPYPWIIKSYSDSIIELSIDSIEIVMKQIEEEVDIGMLRSKDIDSSNLFSEGFWRRMNKLGCP